MLRHCPAPAIPETDRPSTAAREKILASQNIGHPLSHMSGNMLTLTPCDKSEFMSPDMQIKAGLRVAIQPHGGHFWSSMGQVQRPMDIVSLRIDNQV